MVKKSFICLSVVAAACFFVTSCTEKKAKPQLAVPVDKVTMDTTISFSKDAACKIHINYAFLKGNEYAVANDSLLRMGTLQPNYFATSLERLTRKCNYIYGRNVHGGSARGRIGCLDT